MFLKKKPTKDKKKERYGNFKTNEIKITKKKFANDYCNRINLFKTLYLFVLDSKTKKVTQHKFKTRMVSDSHNFLYYLL